MSSNAGRSRNATSRAKAIDTRNRAARYAAKFAKPIPRHLNPSTIYEDRMTTTTPPAASPAPAPVKATEMTPQQYAAARDQIRRGHVPTFQPARGGN